MFEIKYNLEPLTPFCNEWPRWIELFKSADKERNKVPAVLGFNIDFEYFLYQQKRNNLVISTARTEEDLLIGITVHTIYKNPHDFNLLVGQRRMQYVVPEFRGRGIATTMLELSHTEMKRRGVRMALLNTRLHRAQKLGYTRMETVWWKEL